VPVALVLAALCAGAESTTWQGAPVSSIKAITWNVERPQGKRLDGVIEFLSSQDAHVIALQEVYEGDAGHIRSQLRARTSKPWEARFYRGLMLLTHLPVLGHQELWMPYPDRWGPGRPALGILLSVGGVGLRAFNAHLACCESVESRQRQVHALTGWMQQLGGPAIVAGDFNAEPSAPEIGQPSTPAGRGMGAEYLDVWTGPGGETHRNPQPRRRIDYWFVSKTASRALTAQAPRTLDVCSGWTFTRTEAGEGGPSCLADHRPVEVTFRIAPASPAAPGGAP
jgi:endonuclease/exonuclease/phosphatase family metal-dependent hydrolase